MPRWAAHALPIAVGLTTLAFISPALAHAVDVWSTTEEFSFGFLVIPLALGLVYWRRKALALSIERGSLSGLPIVVAAIGVYLMAERLSIHAIAGLAVSPLLLGMVVFLWGWRSARVLAFPIGFLAFGLGLFRGLLDSVGFALQGMTAVGAASLAHVWGLAVARDGLVLTSDQFAFIVAEPCSGMSSLVSLLALATLWIYLARGPHLGRLGILLSVPVLAVAANSLRVALVLLVASWFGQDAALGFFHSASSLVLFTIALTGMLGISWLVGCRALSPAI